MLVAAMAGLIEPCKAQFTIVTNNGAITITGYSGTDGSVIIPSSTNGYPVTGIATNVFQNDTYITNLVVPAGVNYLGTNCFGGCTNLASITVPGVITNEVTFGSTEFDTPYKVVFFDDPITNIVIAPGSTYVIDYAFIGLNDWFPQSLRPTNLVVSIPEGVTNLGQFSFNDILDLSSVTLPESLTYIGQYAFGANIKLQGITIPAGVTNVDFAAFNDTYDLGYAIFEGGPVSIGAYAFQNCSLMTNLTFGGAVNTIGTNAFSGCSDLQNLVFPGGAANIGMNAFENCTALTNVSILDTFSFISDYAFDNCSSLASATVPGAVSDGENEEYGTISGPYWHIFAGTTAPVEVNSITFAPGSTFIISNACSGMALTDVTIPSSVTNIEYRAFYNNEFLTTVNIPNGVTSIGNYAFESCIDLPNITLPNGLLSIGLGAFSGCVMSSVTIPGSVTNLQSDAFGQCGNLNQVYFTGNAPDAGTDTSVFSLVAPGAVVYYLPGATGWGPIYDGLPTELWNPQATNFSTSGGQFGFDVVGPTNAPVVVLACTNLANPVWLPVSTNTLPASGIWSFTDPQWRNYPNRYYRFGAR